MSNDIQTLAGVLAGDVKIISHTNVSGVIPTSGYVSGSIASTSSEQSQFFLRMHDGKEAEIRVPGILGARDSHVLGVAKHKGEIIALHNQSTGTVNWYPENAKRSLNAWTFARIIGVAGILILLLITLLTAYDTVASVGYWFSFREMCNQTPDDIMCVSRPEYPLNSRLKTFVGLISPMLLVIYFIAYVSRRQKTRKALINDAKFLAEAEAQRAAYSAA